MTATAAKRKGNNFQPADLTDFQVDSGSRRGIEPVSARQLIGQACRRLLRTAGRSQPWILWSSRARRGGLLLLGRGVPSARCVADGAAPRLLNVQGTSRVVGRA